MTLAPFISLDGIDGTGKSTQCRLLQDWLQSRGIPSTTCADPGGTPLGQELRRLLLESRLDISPRTEALMFMASRAELVSRVIRPALEAGTVVVSDRFVLANVVYQGHTQGLSPDELWQLGRFSTGGLLPDLTIILDMPVGLASGRRARAADRMESRGPDFMTRVRAGYMAEALTRGIPVVDASESIESVHDRIVELVQQRLRLGMDEVRP